jgi:hypothetical protein
VHREHHKRLTLRPKGGAGNRAGAKQIYSGPQVSVLPSFRPPVQFIDYDPLYKLNRYLPDFRDDRGSSQQHWQLQ